MKAPTSSKPYRMSPAAVSAAATGRAATKPQPQPRLRPPAADAGRAPGPEAADGPDIVVSARRPQRALEPPTVDLTQILNGASRGARAGAMGLMDGRSIATPEREANGVRLLPLIDPRTGQPMGLGDAQARYRQTGEHLGLYPDESAAMQALQSMIGPS